MIVGKFLEILSLNKYNMINRNFPLESNILSIIFIKKDYYLVFIVMQDQKLVKEDLVAMDIKVLMHKPMLNGKLIT